MIAPNVTSPVLKDLFRRSAQMKLHFIVLGANIAGLSSAYHLKQAGHDVTIIESRTLALEHRPVALCMPPNMTRPLLRCGLGAQLRKCARKCTSMTYQSGLTLDLLADMQFSEDMMVDLDADIMIINYDHLMDILYKLAIDSGVEIQFGKTVLEVDVNTETPSVTLLDGTVLHGDVLVGVHGESSHIRPLLEAESAEQEGDDRVFFADISFSVRAAEIEDSAFRDQLLSHGEAKWCLFTGNKWTLQTLPKDDGLEVFVHLFLDERTFVSEMSVSSAPTLKDLVLKDIHPNLRKLINKGRNVSRKRHVSRPRLMDWHDDDGRLVVIGEAAYILNPGSAHAAALAVGDAAVLGALFSHIHDRDQVSRLLSAFQELRQDRCENVGKWELSVLTNCSLPPGPKRDARDSQLQNAMQAASSGDGDQGAYLAQEWEELWRVFEYDPYEAADEWWVEWGVIPDRMTGWNDAHAHLCVEVQDEFNLTEATDSD